MPSMIEPDALASLLTATAHELATHGATTWQRSDDWVRADRRPIEATRGGGFPGALSDDALERIIGDRQASAFQAKLAKTIESLAAEAAVLRALIRIANPETPRAEIGAGCQSCFRDGGRYEPIHEGRYRRACRWCGEWRAEHGDWPPLAVVRWRGRNPGKRVPVKVVEEAAG